MSTLRPYQVDACKATLKSLKTHDRTLVVMPTGTGKTRMAASIVQVCLGAGKRVLWLAHRKELIEQAAEALEQNTGHKAAIEKGDQKEAHVERDGELPMLVCASVQSMYRRVHRFDPSHFRLVVADEAHHTPAKSWSQILEHFTNAKIVGLTATPERADKRALGEVFQEVAYVLEILPAINDGWLVPLRQLAIETEYDLSAVRTVGGDLNAGDLESVLTEIKALQSVAVPLVDAAGERPTIVFAVTKLHARLLGEAIQKCTERTVEVLTGDTPDDERDDIMRRFRDGDVGFLVNVQIATEGVDLPVAACIAMARPTKSEALYAQMLGRGTRPLPGLVDVQPNAAARREAIARSGKPDCLILDFVGNSGRHTLVHAIDIFAGSVPEPVLEVAKGMLAERPELALQEAIEAARAFIQDKELAELQRRAREHYTAFEVSPFLAMALEDPGPSGWGEQASGKQLGVLERIGVPHPENYDRRQATQLIGQTIRRRQAGKATYKQCAALIRNGVPPPKVRELSFQDASSALDAMQANSWKLPREWHDRLIGGENRA